MPDIRAFRALRYDPASVPDLSLVVAPPYDVIDAAERERLVARHPANVVRLDLPAEEPGDAPDDRYRRTARTLAAWRSDGTLHKDPHPSIYVYEQTYRVPGTDVDADPARLLRPDPARAVRAGFGVLPHEHTLSAPREDRYKLLRATGVNTSPVVGLYEDPDGRGRAVLDELTRRRARRRGRPTTTASAIGCGRSPPTATLPPASRRSSRSRPAGPVTIADGHHRYETALRYRDERRMSRSCEEDPAFDYMLMLFLDAVGEPLTVLPTHRIVGGLDDGGVERLLGPVSTRSSRSAATSPRGAAGRFGAAGLAHGGEGRFGLWTRAGGAVLTARRDRVRAVPARRRRGSSAGSMSRCSASRSIGWPGSTPRRSRPARSPITKSADDAIDRVDTGLAGADAAFLLEPTPVASVEAVAVDGDVMPQKSTYFYPKALTGLVINPLEW